MNIFEQATKSKLRFEHKGYIDTEMLWDLSLVNLDKVYKNLKSQLKEADGDSLLAVTTTEDVETKLKMEVVKHIFDARQAENLSKLQAKERAAKRQEIMGLIALKEQNELQGKSKEELLAMLESV